MGLLVGELGQEVLVDATEDVTGDLLQLVGVQRPQQLAENVVVQLLVLALGQNATEAVVVGLDGVHGCDDRLGAVFAVGQRDEMIELGLGLQEDGALLGEVHLGERGGLAAACGDANPQVGTSLREVLRMI